jgi:hypothetical protein
VGLLTVGRLLFGNKYWISVSASYWEQVSLYFCYITATKDPKETSSLA